MLKSNLHKEKESSWTDIRPRFAVPVPHLNVRVRGSVANPGGLRNPRSGFLNIAGAACFALIVFAQISNIGSTVSYFSDVEQSLGNFFVADPVYFTVQSSTTTPVVLGSGEPTVLSMVPGEASDLVQYQVTATGTAGDATLCNAINVLATAPFPYDGPLVGLATGLTTETGPWAMNFSVPQNMTVAADTSCSVALVYQGWNASSTPGQGYTDMQKVSLTFVLPASPDSSQGGSAAPAETTADTMATSTDSSISNATSTDPIITVDTNQSTTTQDVTPPNDTPAPPPADTPPADATPPADIASTTTPESAQ